MKSVLKPRLVRNDRATAGSEGGDFVSLALALSLLSLFFFGFGLGAVFCLIMWHGSTNQSKNSGDSGDNPGEE